MSYTSEEFEKDIQEVKNLLKVIRLDLDKIKRDVKKERYWIMCQRLEAYTPLPSSVIRLVADYYID
jgi:hypothetical protein